MTSARVSPSVEPLIADALKKLPMSQTKEQFTENAILRYADDFKRDRYRTE